MNELDSYGYVLDLPNEEIKQPEFIVSNDYHLPLSAFHLISECPECKGTDLFYFTDASTPLIQVECYSVTKQEAKKIIEGEKIETCHWKWNVCIN